MLKHEGLVVSPILLSHAYAAETSDDDLESAFEQNIDSSSDPLLPRGREVGCDLRAAAHTVATARIDTTTRAMNDARVTITVRIDATARAMN